MKMKTAIFCFPKALVLLLLKVNVSEWFIAILGNLTESVEDRTHRLQLNHEIQCPLKKSCHQKLINCSYFLRVIIYRDVYFCAHYSRRLAELTSAEIIRYWLFHEIVRTPKTTKFATLFQSGLPGSVLVRSPVIRSFAVFSNMSSMAI